MQTDAMKCYKNLRVALWAVPPRSPDLSPIERHWAWLRKRLRKRGMDDLQHKRPVLGKMAYLKRVKNICASKASHSHASKCYFSLRKVCQEVLTKRARALQAECVSGCLG